MLVANLVVANLVVAYLVVQIHAGASIDIGGQTYMVSITPTRPTTTSRVFSLETMATPQGAPRRGEGQVIERDTNRCRRVVLPAEVITRAAR